MEKKLFRRYISINLKFQWNGNIQWRDRLVCVVMFFALTNERASERSIDERVCCNLNAAVRIELPTFYERSMCVPRIITVVRYISLRCARSVRELEIFRDRYCSWVLRVCGADVSCTYGMQISGRPDTFALADPKGSDVLSVHEWEIASSCARFQILRSPIRQIANASDITDINLPGCNTASLTTNPFKLAAIDPPVSSFSLG